MWTSQTCFAKRDAVIMVMRHGTACAPSAGGRNTSVYDRNRSRMTLLWQKSKSFCIGADAFTSVFFTIAGQFCRFMFSPVKWGCKWFSVFVPRARLQREEEAAYAISHGTQAQSQATASQTHPALPSLGPFSKFEEKKTNEKTRKVTTVKKFFSTSSSRTLKKGMTSSVVWAGPSVDGVVNMKNQNSVLLYSLYKSTLT